MRVALVLALLLSLVAAPPAHAGELIDRAVAGLQANNVYVDPDADPKLSDADVEQAVRRDRRRTGPDRCTWSTRRRTSRARRAAIRPPRWARSRAA